MTGILVSRASLLDARVGGDEQTHREHQILHVPVPADQGAEGRPRCALLTGSRLGGSGCPPRGAARCLLRPLPVRRQRWLLQNVPKTRPRRTEAGAHRGRELMGWQPPVAGGRRWRPSSPGSPRRHPASCQPSVALPSSGPPTAGRRSARRRRMELGSGKKAVTRSPLIGRPKRPRGRLGTLQQERREWEGERSAAGPRAPLRGGWGRGQESREGGGQRGRRGRGGTQWPRAGRGGSATGPLRDGRASWSSTEAAAAARADPRAARAGLRAQPPVR